MLKPRKRPAKRVSLAKRKMVVEEEKKPVAVRAGKSKKISKDRMFDLIKNKAYEFYLKRGAVPGNELNDWYEAEAMVKKELGL